MKKNLQTTDLTGRRPLLVLTLGILLLTSLTSYAQQRVTGVVKDETGSGLPGATVLIKGTSTGTVTDAEGKYSLTASGDATLVVSYTGYLAQEIPVNNRSVIDVNLAADLTTLSEVVVTAFGLEKEKKELTYSTQNVKLEGLAEARPNQNLVNGLQGKVAGLSIQTSGNGVSGGSKVVLRGNRSINGNSQALYVVDGVPLGGDISNISPDDVESISVLKGANAAALYGSRANNGAIIVTTKKGRSGFNVDLNSTFTVDRALLLWDYQNEFGQGSEGTYLPNSTFSWGPRLDGRQVAHWSPSPELAGTTYPFNAHPDNVKDFYDTGTSLATNLAISAGNEKNSTYFSYTYEDRAGIVPNNELERHNLNLRLQNKISDRLTLNAKANFVRTLIDNELVTGEAFDNPNRHAYRLPRNISTAQASNFEYIDELGRLRQNFWVPGDNGGANPYWTVNRNINEVEDDRIIAFASLSYELLDGLTVLVRSGLDRTNRFKQESWYNDTYVIAQNGNYRSTSSVTSDWNTDALITYTKSFGDFSVNLNAGANARQQRFKDVETENQALNVPNLFTIGNAQNLRGREELTRSNINSWYTFGNFGWKEAIFLDLTFRADYSSTLPSPYRFTYPSVGLSVVANELLQLPSAISFLKLRGSYAEVGNDTDPFLLNREAVTENGRIFLSPTNPVENLLPERTRSVEVGFDARFLNDRLGIDFTYYQTNSEDQLFRQDVTSAGGQSRNFINGGDIQNKGVEVILTATPIQGSEFTWDLTFNFARNISEVARLAEGIPEINYGANFMRSFRLIEGEEWGDIYSRGFQRDDQGRVLVDADGLPLITSGLDVVIGNFNPDWLGGIVSAFTYKNFNANFVVDIRQGGDVVSFTEAILAADGLLDYTLTGRDGTLVFGQNVFGGETAVQENGIPNNVGIDAETFWTNLGGRNAPIGEAFVRDASNVRMREISLGYRLPESILANLPFKRAKISLVGRNLFFFSNQAEVLDPEVVTNATTATASRDRNGNRDAIAGITSDGFESFAPPTTRSFGVNIQLGF